MIERDEFGQPARDLDNRDCALLVILEEIASPDINPDKSLSAYMADIYDSLDAELSTACTPLH